MTIFCKIFLSYEKPFWSTDFKGVHLIWLPGYVISTKNIETLNHDLKEKKMWFHSISSLSLVYSFHLSLVNCPACLSTYILRSKIFSVLKRSITSRRQFEVFEWNTFLSIDVLTGNNFFSLQ